MRVSNVRSQSRFVIALAIIELVMVSCGGSLKSITTLPTPIFTDTTTPTDTATSTPEQEMILQDWEEVFSGPFISEDGKQHELAGIWEKAEVYTNPDQVAALSRGTQMIILNPDGGIIVWANPDEAAEKVRKGAIVLVTEFPTPKGLAATAILAANNQYLKGNEKIYVEFNECDVSNYPFVIGDIYRIELYFPLQIFDDSGRRLSPVVRLPKHFEVFKTGAIKSESPTPAMLHSKYWLDEIIKAGYDKIIILPNSSVSPSGH